MDKSHTPAPQRGAVDPAVATELPGLRLDWLAVTVAAGSGTERSGTARSGTERSGSHSRSRSRSGSGSREAHVERLRALSDRYRGATVIAMRTQPIPRAYRSFYRQIGLDPDIERIPSERAAMERLLHGGFRPSDVISDACLIAVLETGVPVWALDAAAVDPDPPGLGIGLADGAGAPPGSLVVRDRRSVQAPLFGSPLAGHAPGPSAPIVVLYALAVSGVPQIHVDEALWTVADLLGA